MRTSQPSWRNYGSGRGLTQLAVALLQWGHAEVKEDGSSEQQLWFGKVKKWEMVHGEPDAEGEKETYIRAVVNFWTDTNEKGHKKYVWNQGDASIATWPDAIIANFKYSEWFVAKPPGPRQHMLSAEGVKRRDYEVQKARMIAGEEAEEGKKVTAEDIRAIAAEGANEVCGNENGWEERTEEEYMVDPNNNKRKKKRKK
jgi:hypothetical protein